MASIRETIQYILDTGCSISRFGDAEMKVMHQDNISYQTNSPKLCDKLKEVLNRPIPKHIVGLIDAFDDLKQYVSLSPVSYIVTIGYRSELYENHIDLPILSDWDLQMA